MSNQFTSLIGWYILPGVSMILILACRDADGDIARHRMGTDSSVHNIYTRW